MFRKLALLASSFTVAAVLVAAVGPPLFSDDFSSGNDSKWTRIDLLAPLGGTTYDASSGRYEMFSNAPLPALPFQVFTGSVATNTVNNSAFRNCTIRATVRFNNDSTSAVVAGRVDPSGAASGVITGWGAGLNNNTNQISIGRVDATGAFPPSKIVDLVVAPFAFTEGVDYQVELRFTGAHIRLTVWPAGGNKPHQPQLSVNETTYQHQTAVALGLFSTSGVAGQLSGSFDNVVAQHGNN